LLRRTSVTHTHQRTGRAALYVLFPLSDNLRSPAIPLSRYFQEQQTNKQTQSATFYFRQDSISSSWSCCGTTWRLLSEVTQTQNYDFKRKQVRAVSYIAFKGTEQYGVICTVRFTSIYKIRGEFLTARKHRSVYEHRSINYSF
jgi:hypothetical protein